MIQKEKEKYEISFTDQEISKMSKHKYKRVIDKKVENFALNSMLITARTQSKCSQIVKSYSSHKFTTQDYIKSNFLSKELQQTLFALRSESYPFKINYKWKFQNDMSCRICGDENSIEDFSHTINCSGLRDELKGEVLNFKDVYGNLRKQTLFMNSFIKLHRKRQTILEIDQLI